MIHAFRRQCLVSGRMLTRTPRDEYLQCLRNRFEHRMTIGRIVLGSVIAAAGVSIGVLYLHGSWPSLPADVDANALRELLVREGASLAFFWLAIGYLWLALGYFHHGYLIRKNSALLK